MSIPMIYKHSQLRLVVWMLACIVINSCTVAENRQVESPAEKALKQSISRNPNDAQAHYRLGLFYFSESLYDRAISHLEKSIEIKPDYAEAHYSLGLSRQRVGKQQAAIESFHKAIELKPDYWSEAYSQIGAAYREMGDKASIEQSLISFNKASDKCTDTNNSLCLAIRQNIVITYLDLNRMGQEAKNLEDRYLERAIDLAEHTLKTAPIGTNVHQYAMLLNTLGDGYVMKGGRDNMIKAKTAYNKALSLLDKDKYAVEHSMIQNSLNNLTELLQSANDGRVVERRINNHGRRGEQKLLFRVVDKNGRPLRDALISLHEKRDDEFIKTHFKDKPTDKQGTAALSAEILQLPSGSELFIRTADGFYWSSVKIANLAVSDGSVKVVVPQTGVIIATITYYAKNIEQPLIALVYRLNEKGSYEESYGMGIGLSVGYTFKIHGLPTGTYKLRIKKDYEDSHVLYEKDAIKVFSGEITNVNGISLR